MLIAAGKTTLLDVLAHRKSTGTITGDILCNGVKWESNDYKCVHECCVSLLSAPLIRASVCAFCGCRNVIGYVQQQDVHIGTTTVREALEFAAALRLPAVVTAEQRKAMVNEVLEMLDLMNVADWLVGDSDYNGISPSQRKRLTIGTELVANPSVLYVDGACC